MPAATLRTASAGPRLEHGRHPDVDHQHPRPGLAGQHVDGRAARAEVGHHLGRDLLRPGRHALGHHAVVTGEDRDGGRRGERWRTGAGDAAQLRAQGLQAARARRPAWSGGGPARPRPPTAARSAGPTRASAAANAPVPACSMARLLRSSAALRSRGGGSLARARPRDPGPKESSRMTFPSDLEIAQHAALKPLPDIAAEMGIGPHLLEPYGDSVAKIKLDAIEELADRPRAQVRRRVGRSRRPRWARARRRRRSVWARPSATSARRRRSPSASRRWARRSGSRAAPPAAATAR